MVPKGMRMKMILLLIIMTPGIPEYLTGSSPFNRLFYDPFGFLMGLGLNIGLYSTGALLIREFTLKYNKGWGTVLLLGCAYGIMEEGISVHTFFQVSGQPVGLLAIYGRFAGVNWVWALGLTFFHAIFSIALPLLFLSIAYPKYSRERLLGRRGSVTVLSLYLLDVLVLNLLLKAVSTRVFPTSGDFIFFLILSSVIVVIAYIVPGDILAPRGMASGGTKKFYLLGMIVFTLYTVYAFVPVGPGGSARIPPLLDMVLYTFAYLMIMVLIIHYMPRKSNDRQKLGLAVGLMVPLLVWAGLMELSGAIPLIAVVAVIAIALMFKLRSMVKSRIMQPDVAPS